MKRLILSVSFVLGLCLTAYAGSMTLLGAGKIGAVAITYQGPGDVVSGAKGFWSCGRAYNAAYANGTNPMCDVVIFATGVAACTIRAATTGFADLSGSYCAGSTTLATACASGCHVSKMYDQTGALACAGSTACDVVQATNVDRPPLTLSALNSLPCLEPNNSGYTGLLASSTALTLAQPLSLHVLAERTGITLYGASITDNTNNFYTLNIADTLHLSFGTDIASTITDSVFHYNIGIANNTSSLIVSDGSIVGGPAAGGTNSFSGTIYLANTPALANTYQGQICEEGIWPVAFSSGQYGLMNTNVHSAANGWNF